MNDKNNKHHSTIPPSHNSTVTPFHHSTAILIALTFLIYLNSLPNDFIFDDIPLVQNSLNVMNMGFLDLLTSYRPLRYLSYALDYRIFGMEPMGFRFMNIVYHALTVISLFWMLKVFGLSKKAAFISSILFAIHPVHTDSVAYISGRRDVIMGLFYVLSVGWFMKFYNGIGNAGVKVERWNGGGQQVAGGTVEWSNGGVEENSTLTHLHNSTGQTHGSAPTHLHTSTGLPLLILSLFFMFLSISSKEMGATIPLIFVLYIIYKDGSKLFEKKWFYPAAMSLLLLFSFFVFYAISSGGSGLASLSGFQFHGNSPKVHYLTAATIWLHYLKMTVFPLKLILDNANYPLVLDWNFLVFFSILSMFVYGWVVFFVGATFMTPKKPESPTQGAINRAPTTGEHTGSPLHHSTIPPFHGRKHGFAPTIVFWMVFFVITLAPVLQIIPLHEIVALHYLYVPVIGFCAIVGIIYDYFAGEHTGSPLHNSTITPFHGRFVNRPYTRHASLVTLLLLLSLFSIRTITRNFELKDIWTAIHADEKWMPLSFRGYFTIGAQYVEMKFPDKAGEYYQKALSTGSWDGNLLGNIIGYHILKGEHSEAVNFYEEMLKKNEFITSTGTLNMAVLYMLNGNCERAVQLATSFSPLSNQVKRIELIKKCDTYEFDKFDDTEIEDIYHKQELMKSLGLEVERKPYLRLLVTSDEFEGDEKLNLIRELAVVNLQSDIPEAIKYYKLERELLIKLGKPVPDIVERSIAVLEDYQYKVLVEGKYYKLEW